MDGGGRQGSSVYLTKIRGKSEALGRTLIAVVTVASFTLAFASTAVRADTFDVDSFDAEVTQASGKEDAQAGSHPFAARTTLTFKRDPNDLLRTVGQVHDVEVTLPPGFSGNPQAVDFCDRGDFYQQFSSCPASSQVGLVATDLGGYTTAPIYNMKPARGYVAEFGFKYAGAGQLISVKVRPRDYRLVAVSRSIPTSLYLRGVAVVLWGVPADSAHDAFRLPNTDASCLGDMTISGAENTCSAEPLRSGIAPRPLLSNPADCSAGPFETVLRADAWSAPATYVTRTAVSHDASNPPVPLGVLGCDRLTFAPRVSVEPTQQTADAPTGLDAHIDLPQAGALSPKDLAEPPLKRVDVRLPEGLTINPGSANGLAACEDQDLDLDSGDDQTCPEASKIGTVVATSPAIVGDVAGDVYLRPQRSRDPESGEMFRLALVLKHQERGVLVKLPGSVTASAATGRLIATFDNNPQLPVEAIDLKLKTGPRAPLIMPATCGEKTISTELTSWAGDDVRTSTSFDVACTPGLNRFAPSFAAGTVNPAAGASSPFSLRITKPDGQSDLNGLALSLPEGLLATLKDNIGTQVGTARVAAGPGSSPYWLSGPVVLEGPYGDAPFSLRVTVPAIAGPFNLGDVVVRQKIYVDPHDAHATVVSDPLPTIVKGVPVRLQNLQVDIDKAGFMKNPTSCATKEIKGTLASAAGQTAQLANRFQVGDCASLGYTPKLAMNMSGKGQTKDGSHPVLTARLTPPAGDANNKKVTVTLPLSLALEPGNANGLCEPADATKNQCAAKTIVGSAQAQSILPDTLKAPVYFVRGERRDSKGMVRKTLPKLFIPLAANGVTVNVWGDSDVEDDRLVTRFTNLPDAPFSSFDLTINGGKHGILAVSNTNTCAATQIADAEFGGQNGKTYTSRVTMGTPCALGIVKSSHTSTALKVTVGGLGAGKVSASGKGVTKSSRSLASATTATLTLKLAKATRRMLARGGDVRVKVKVAFTARGQKKAKTATKSITIHGAKKR